MFSLLCCNNHKLDYCKDLYGADVFTRDHMSKHIVTVPDDVHVRNVLFLDVIVVFFR